MKLVIETQCYENYASHEGFNGFYDWRAKGGDTYIVPLGDNPCSVERIIETVKPVIEIDNESFREDIIGYNLVPNNWVSEYERDQMEYRGYVQYPCEVILLTEQDGRQLARKANVGPLCLL